MKYGEIAADNLYRACYRNYNAFGHTCANCLPTLRKSRACAPRAGQPRPLNGLCAMLVQVRLRTAPAITQRLEATYPANGRGWLIANGYGFALFSRQRTASCAHRINLQCILNAQCVVAECQAGGVGFILRAERQRDAAASEMTCHVARLCADYAPFIWLRYVCTLQRRRRQHG